jgi:hypothetical protein
VIMIVGTVAFTCSRAGSYPGVGAGPQAAPGYLLPPPGGLPGCLGLAPALCRAEGLAGARWGLLRVARPGGGLPPLPGLGLPCGGLLSARRRVRPLPGRVFHVIRRDF